MIIIKSVKSKKVKGLLALIFESVFFWW